MADTDTISRQSALLAAKAGGEAQRAGQEVSACPYKLDGSVDDRYHGQFWLKGFRAATMAASD